MEQPAFNIFEALSAWGKTLPGWQFLLLNKLVATEELCDEALDEVFAEYLIEDSLVQMRCARSGTWHYRSFK